MDNVQKHNNCTVEISSQVFMAELVQDVIFCVVNTV
jgi:hypothetical protein